MAGNLPLEGEAPTSYQLSLILKKLDSKSSHSPPSVYKKLPAQQRQLSNAPHGFLTGAVLRKPTEEKKIQSRLLTGNVAPRCDRLDCVDGVVVVRTTGHGGSVGARTQRPDARHENDVGGRA